MIKNTKCRILGNFDEITIREFVFSLVLIDLLFEVVGTNSLLYNDMMH